MLTRQHAGTRARLGRAAAIIALATTALLGASLAPAGAAAAPPKLMPVKGFTYVKAPAEFNSFVTLLKSTGYVTGATIKGAKYKKDVQVVVLLAQYNAKITKGLDKLSIKKVLDGATSGLVAIAGNKKVKDYAMVGTHVRAIDLNGITVVVTYIKGGKLLELFAPTSKSVLAYSALYLASAKAHGQKLAK